MGEYALEHFRSRAIRAEKELEAARSVLAALRGWIRLYEERDCSEKGLIKLGEAYTRLRERQREHDQQFWTRDDAMNAVAELLTDDDDD